MIFAQEKRIIVNFDTAQAIEAKEKLLADGACQYEIRALFDDAYAALGVYSTREQAEEVLENIFYVLYNTADTYRMPADKGDINA